MERSPFLLLQVSYRTTSLSCRSSNYCLVAVSCPTDTLAFLQCVYALFESFFASLLSHSQLLVAGDVESNPGPVTDSPGIQEKILATVQRIEDGQAGIISEIKTLKEQQKVSDEQIQRLTTKVAELEAELTRCKATQNTPASEGELTVISSKLHDVAYRCDDAENRLRRSNLLFYGIIDDANESWASSEGKVIDFCSRHFEISIHPDSIERAHRIGKFNTEKKRPIIVKFSRFKEKDRILSSGFKLKGTPFSVGEDFSISVRHARRKLIEFAKNKNVSFRLSFDKLKIDNTIYMYN
ncbi:unnamed protein product, partial [Ixodes persulcatus]